jgi:hypothetical protein
MAIAAMSTGAVMPSGSTSGVLNGGGAIDGPVLMAFPGQLNVCGAIGSGAVNDGARPDGAPMAIGGCDHANAGDGITGQPGVVDPKGA